MTTVQILKNWTDYWMSDDQFIAQSPNSAGRWADVKFHLEPVASPDYVIVMNRVTYSTEVRVRPSRVWGLMQEPPNELYAPMHRGQKAFSKVLTSNETLQSPRYVLSHPAIPWFVEKSYDQLSVIGPGTKLDRFCCITSKNILFRGHVKRLQLLKALHNKIPIDIYGRGIQPVDSKWAVLSDYKYSLVMENHINSWYWTEKLADSFLAWTIPFYIGCSDIGKFFPKGAFVLLNGKTIDVISEQIHEALASDYWKHHLDELAEARRIVLTRLGTFPYLARLVTESETSGSDVGCEKRNLTIRAVGPNILNSWTRAKARAAYVNTRTWVGWPVASFP